MNSNQQAWTHRRQHVVFLIHQGLTRTGSVLRRKYKTNAWEHDVWLVPCIAYHQQWLIHCLRKGKSYTHKHTPHTSIHAYREKCTKQHEGTHTHTQSKWSRTRDKCILPVLNVVFWINRNVLMKQGSTNFFFFKSSGEMIFNISSMPF